jgi:hypothetical protein
MGAELRQLTTAVQQNCHIADAIHAGDYTLCIYLLKMREYYRWEKGIGFDADVPRDDLGAWLQARERLWESLESQAFGSLRLGERCFDPFDTEQVNADLLPLGLVYSAGLGRSAKPHFFLGRLERRERRNGYTILISADEYARDLTAPPGMTLNKTIFVRRESIRRMVWEQVEEWGWKRLDNPMGRAIASYDFARDLPEALEAMTADVLDIVLEHEVGEVIAGEALGSDWEDMLATLPRSRLEFMARAIRDLLADCVSTLPTLLERAYDPSLHFFIGHMNGMRRDLFPGLLAAYQRWVDGGDLAAMREITARGRDHWMAAAQRLLGGYRELGADDLSRLEGLLEQSRL